MTEKETLHCGMIAVVGRYNVGKSTLINALLDEKVSIVSPVAQTTRNVVRGILTEPRGQLVFLDTPGVHQAGSELGKIMNRQARAAIEGVDLVLLVLDASVEPRMEDEGWMRRLLFEDVPVIGVLNKVDLEEQHADAYPDLWARLEEEKGQKKDVMWLNLSALHAEGTTGLLDILFKRVPESPLLFPEDILTDFPRKWTIADSIREKYFLSLKHELPHAIAVEVPGIEEHEDGSWDVDTVVYVNRPSQKGIVIGHKGRMIRKVRRQAEHELSEMYDRPVRVRIRVKIEKKWAGNFWMLKRLGYQ